jgi:hypothetical protein
VRLPVTFICTCGFSILFLLPPRSITYLNLASNDLAPEGAKVICKALKANINLVSLDLSNFSGCSTGGDIMVEGAEAVAEMLMTNQTLSSLNLSGNAIGGFDRGSTMHGGATWASHTPEGPRALARALEHNTAMLYLHVSGNNVDLHTAAKIRLRLEINRINEHNRRLTGLFHM